LSSVNRCNFVSVLIPCILVNPYNGLEDRSGPFRQSGNLNGPFYVGGKCSIKNIEHFCRYFAFGSIEAYHRDRI
jgi:hypothetical protein